MSELLVKKMLVGICNPDPNSFGFAIRKIYTICLFFAFSNFCKGQSVITDFLKPTTKAESKDVITPNVPKIITRNIIQDKKGNIWIAAFDGIFRYDGKSFTHITNKVSGRFFSVLEDQKGNLWFGTIGSGVYRYDGQSFKNFTTDQGLLNNEVGCMYEDKAGNIWFGVNGGTSCYNGKFFRNFKINGDAMIEDMTGIPSPNMQRPPKEVTSIIEDKKGKFWFATRGNTLVYDGKKFTVITHNGTPFTNVRCVIEDKKGDIWLGGNDGLWRYDGNTFTNLTPNFVGYIHEDRKGNIWTSSENTTDRKWAISRYNAKSLVNKNPTATEIASEYGATKRMIFGILEAYNGDIWFGSIDGVYRYDGRTITHFKDK